MIATGTKNKLGIAVAKDLRAVMQGKSQSQVRLGTAVGAFWTQLDVKSKTAQREHPLSRLLLTNKWLRGSDLN